MGKFIPTEIIMGEQKKRWNETNSRTAPRRTNIFMDLQVLLSFIRTEQKSANIFMEQWKNMAANERL